MPWHLKCKEPQFAIPSNIAEGAKRNHTLEFIQFLGISNASAAELETQLLISKKQYPNTNYAKAESLLVEIQKMLYVLIRKLREKKHYSRLTIH